MTVDFENPFAGYGNVVEGERFIGRKHDLSVIDGRVMRDRDGASVAIVGEPKIGKSSLAHAATVSRKDELLAKGIIPVWINLAEYDGAKEFYNSLVSMCRDELNKVGWLSDTIKLAANEALEEGLPAFEQTMRRQQFFGKVKVAGRRVVFVLDEFDHARKLFKNNVENFQRLRNLAYKPEWRVYYIATSRRSVKSIETISSAISTLTLTFTEHYLDVFNPEDLDEHLQRYAAIGINVSTDLRERLLFYTGGHPYLLDVIGYELIEICRERRSKEPDFNEGLRRVEFNFISYFNTLIEYLSENGTLPLLLDALFTKSANPNSQRLYELIKYGIVKTSPDGRLVGFSDYFHGYLKMVERESDLRSIWARTEVALRSLITNTLEECFGDDWIQKLERSHPELKVNVFEPCRARQIHEVGLFGNRASDNLLDYTYPADLFAIMFKEWGLFQPILGADKTYWSQRAALLGRIRNIIMHIREHKVLTRDQRKTGEGYCEEILRLIEAKYGTP
jgi:hypothetical protein